MIDQVEKSSNRDQTEDGCDPDDQTRRSGPNPDNRADGEEHGIAREEGGNDQTYLGKNDQSNETVNQRPVQGDLGGQMFIDMKAKINNL